jgi:hypothetical protein
MYGALIGRQFEDYLVDQRVFDGQANSWFWLH